jgi:C-terminal processing protease CtpA/Prc
MARFVCLLVCLFTPAVLHAQEKEKPKQKPAFLGVQIAVGKQEGTIIVTLVIPDSPAEKAGLKAGDRLVRVNGVKPATLATAVKVIRSLKPNKKAKLLIERDGKEKTVEAVPVALD